jgi:hypothetical protein
MAVVITVTSAITFGITRYRVPIDVVMIVLGAVGADALLRRWWPASRDGTVQRLRGDHQPDPDLRTPTVPDLVPPGDRYGTEVPV